MVATTPLIQFSKMVTTLAELAFIRSTLTSAARNKNILDIFSILLINQDSENLLKIYDERSLFCLKMLLSQNFVLGI